MTYKSTIYSRLTTGSMCGIHETSHPQNLMSMQINSQNLEHGVAMNNFNTIDTVHKLDGWPFFAVRNQSKCLHVSLSA